MSADARRIWTVAEPFHALTYFAPEASSAFEDAGLRGFWRGYFAGRSAPLGVTSANVVTATFFGFHPDFVARAIPSIWSLVEPQRALEARLIGIDRAVRRLFAADVPAEGVTRAASELRRAIERTPVDGRALFGANAELGWPEPPYLALWHAVTLLREHRGDGHVCALVSAGVGPCESHVLRIAGDRLPLDSIQPYRGWSEEHWIEAADRLRERGWLDTAGHATAAGTRARAEVEATTDRLSTALTDRVSDPELVVDVLTKISRRLVESDEIPYPNPIGVPAPDHLL